MVQSVNGRLLEIEPFGTGVIVQVVQIRHVSRACQKPRIGWVVLWKVGSYFQVPKVFDGSQVFVQSRSVANTGQSM